MNNNTEIKLSPFEKEVVLTTDDASKEWIAYVASPKWIRKFENAQWECINTEYDSAGNILSKTFKAPKKRIKIKGPSVPRNYTEEEKEILRDRMKKARENRNNQN